MSCMLKKDVRQILYTKDNAHLLYEAHDLLRKFGTTFSDSCLFGLNLAKYVTAVFGFAVFFWGIQSISNA